MDFFRRLHQWFNRDAKAIPESAGGVTKKKKKKPPKCKKMSIKVEKPVDAERLGISAITRNEQVIVVGIQAGSPAAGHLLVNDRIRTVNGKQVTDAGQFESAVHDVLDLNVASSSSSSNSSGVHFTFEIYRPIGKKLETPTKSDHKCKNPFLDYLNSQIQSTSQSLRSTRFSMKKILKKLKRQEQRSICHLHDNDLSLVGINNAMYDVKLPPESSDVRRIVAKSADQILLDFSSDFGRTDESSKHSKSITDEVDFQSQGSSADDFWHMESSKSIREDEQVTTSESTKYVIHRRRIGTDVPSGTKLKRPTAHTI